MQMRGVEKLLLASPAWAVLTGRVFIPMLLAGVDLPAQAEMLELGCGAGGETEALARRFPRWRITATDYDPDMVRRAAGRLAYLGDRIRVARADATDLPYPDGTFDLVVAVHVWHHVGAWRTATAEAHRVLRSGGALLLADLAVPDVVASRAPRLVPSGTYRLAELRAALSASGFTGHVRGGRVRGWYRVLARR